MSWKVLGIERTYVAVENLDEAEKFFKDVLGARLAPERIPQLEAMGLQAIGRIVNWGDTRLEVQQATGDDWLSNTIKRAAPGYFMIELEVDNIEEAIRDLRSRGIQVSDLLPVPDMPESGIQKELEYVKEATISRKSACGLLISLIEKKKRPGVTETWY
jgi:catechol 2,3-dioxygenase-like lactoylglutathione lyase family enzyme